MEGLLGAGGFWARPILPVAAVVPATRGADFSPWAGFDHGNGCEDLSGVCVDGETGGYNAPGWGPRSPSRTV